MKYCVEAWSFPSEEEMLDLEEEMIQSAEFAESWQAKEWCWDRMEEGYQTRLYRR